MDSYLASLFDDFAAAARDALDKDDRYLLVDKVHDHLDDLGVYPFPEVLDRILALVEACPQLDYGGSFDGFIEEHRFDAYTPALLASLARQPSVWTIGLLDMTIGADDAQGGQGTNPVRPADYVRALEAVIADDRAPADCRDFARHCIAGLARRGVAV